MMKSKRKNLTYGIKSNHEKCVDHNCYDDREGILRKGPWSREEDICLINYVQINGAQNWKNIANELKRTSKSCRLRWCNQLNPDISDKPFTAKDDDIIIDMVHTIGSKWASIARVLKGRTDNQIKNRWHTILKKKQGPRAPQQFPKRKLSHTAERKLKPSVRYMNGSRSSWPSSTSAPLPALISSSAESVDLASPLVSPNVDLPGAAAGSIDSYLPAASVAPYPSAKHMHPPASLYDDPSPTPTLDWLTSIDLSPPGCDMPDLYHGLFPGPSVFYPARVEQCAPIGEFTAMMMEITGNEGEPNCASALTGSNRLE